MKKNYDLIIIGSGIMGLFTAYFASRFTKNILIIEKEFIGNKKSASFSLTRSIRNDYLSYLYAGLAFEARLLWEELERSSQDKFLIDCGCLNLVKNSITPDIKNTYGYKSWKNLIRLNFKTKKYNSSQLKANYPQFNVELGFMDQAAGLIYVPNVTKILINKIKKSNIQIVEKTTVGSIKSTQKTVIVTTDSGTYTSRQLVITAGIWTNQVLKLIEKCCTQFPLKADRPLQCKYFIPPTTQRGRFLSNKLPVFAYLDIGIYGHPILDGKTKGVKIGYYKPSDLEQAVNPTISSIEDFIAQCMPQLKRFEKQNVTDADQCFYQMVSDDNFILGQLPGFENINVGCGWRGTGYKFAPWIGKTLSQLALQGQTTYQINQFSPNRFNDTAIARTDKIG